MTNSSVLIGGLHCLQVAVLLVSEMFVAPQAVVAPHAVVVETPTSVAALQMMKGRISAIAEDKIMLTIATEQKSFAVTAKTEITLDGQVSKLAQLPIGSPATITVEGAGEKMQAVSIHAMSLK
jgi:hypothetical protein